MALLDPSMFDPNAFQPTNPAGFMSDFGGMMGLLRQPSQGFPQTPQRSPENPQQDDALPPTAIPAIGSMPPGLRPKPQQEVEQGSGLGAAFSKLGDALSDNSNLLMGLGAGFAGAPNIGAGISRALQMGQAASQLDTKQSNKNLTYNALRKQGMDHETALAATQNPDMLKALLPQVFGTKDKTEVIKEYEFAKQSGFKGSFMDYIAAKRAGAGEYALQGIPGVDKDGNPVMVQLGKSGEAIQAKLPAGVTISKEPIKIDAGTHTVLLDPITRQPISTLPKNIAEKAVAAAQGEAQGKAGVNLQATRDRTKSSLDAIREVADSPDLDRVLGWNSKFPNWPGGKAAAIQSKLDYVKSRAFLDAYDTLRGAGAITEQEGQAAARAQANLSQEVDPKTFRENLNVLVRALENGLKRAEAMAAGQFATPNPPGMNTMAPPAGVRPSKKEVDPLGIR